MNILPEPSVRVSVRALRAGVSLAFVASLCGALSLPAQAASSTASAASESVGTSVGSLSGSIQGSSNSSTNAVAEGDYKIIEMAAVADRPGQRRLKLQAMAGEKAHQAVAGEGAHQAVAGLGQPSDTEWFLFVPDAVVAQGQLAAGQTISARQRPYGIEFAQAETRQAFFLVLTDRWYRELQTTPVAL